MSEHNDELHSLFTRRPTEKSVPIGLPLLRCPPTRNIGGIVLSHDLIGCYVHYWKGRTRPCPVNGCDACQEGNSRRWKGYLVIQDKKNGKRGILELPAIACEEVDEFFREHRTLRGYFINVHRVSPKPNARVTVDFSPARFDECQLGEAVPLESILLRMWELPGPFGIRGVAPRAVKSRGDDLDDQTELGLHVG